MNNEAAVEQQLQQDFDNFYNSIYDGKIETPSNILDLFKKGVMSLAPQFHKINSNKLHVISKTNYKQLTIGDLKDVITIILNTPFDKLYNDFNEAMESHLKVQKFVLSYNNHVEEFNKKLQLRKATLLDLTRNVHPNGGGNMKIVN